MRFPEMKYVRPDMDAVEAEFRDLLQELSHAKDPETAIGTVNKLNQLRQKTSKMFVLVNIRNSIDSVDEFYKEEKSFSDKNQPRMQALETEYNKALITSSFRKELEEQFGTQVFRKAELTIKTFSPEIIDDLARENELYTEYSNITSTAKIQFRGETYNIPQMGKYLSSPDRDTRREANAAVWAFMAEHGSEIDAIFDEQVKVRTRIAKKLGYENFVQLGYDRMHRSDYTADMVANFRKQVKQFIAPLATSLRERQRQRIGVDTLYNFDEPFHFQSGNPLPKGDPDWMVAQATRMYDELSPETGEFFRFMVENELMDLVAKTGKRPGGYCTPIPGEKSMFIFSNFNGTVGDVVVLTHEAGHAFMMYEARENTVPEYGIPTFEAAEIHSHSMELLTWPWMDLFFEEDADKYRFVNLSGNIFMLPNLCVGDEFQHWVYENPNATTEERRAKWRGLEREYIPTRQYLDNPHLESGAAWHMTLHFFMRPFYYIDYALAITCAQQFWKKSLVEKESTWADYLHLCQLGGSKSFLELVADANLISPFEDGCMESIVEDIKAWFASIDDSKF